MQLADEFVFADELPRTGAGWTKSSFEQGPSAERKVNLLEVLLKRFEDSDETREFEKGRFDIVRIGGMTIGKATYQPGWRWSEHVRPLANTPLCEVEHVGMVISGKAAAAMKDGKVIELGPGSLFYIPPVPHDSWVIGDEPYVSLHFLGADHYAR
jgi:oxalate decarboxylase/phosphoglucose isomerase-like protein (cupin superfamily)